MRSPPQVLPAVGFFMTLWKRQGMARQENVEFTVLP